MKKQSPKMPHGWDDYESRRDVVQSKRTSHNEDRRRKTGADLPRPHEKLLLDTEDNGSFETAIELETKLDPGAHFDAKSTHLSEKYPPAKKYADSERGYGSGLGGSFPADSYDSDQDESAYYGRPEYP